VSFIIISFFFGRDKVPPHYIAYNAESQESSGGEKSVKMGKISLLGAVMAPKYTKKELDKKKHKKFQNPLDKKTLK